MTRALAALLLLTGASALAVPSGHKWKTNPATYRVFAHASVNGVPDFQANGLPAVRSGFARWTTAQVSCTTWNSTYGGNFTTPTGKAIINANDQKSYVVWLGGVDWTLDNQTLGLTTTTWYTDTNEIIDADMQMNNNREWKVGGALTRVDVESITTHEAGHFLGLEHTANSAAVMYATYPIGELKAALHPLDVTDVCNVYPKMTGGTGQQGAFCAIPADCATSAPACRGAASSGGSKICTIDCTGGQACPTGYSCQADSTGGKACLATVNPSAGDLCKFCTSGSQCASGLCVGDGRHNWCTTTCPNAGSAATACGTGFSCVVLDGTTTFVCQPNAACPKAQCTSATQCPVGYSCTSGMCEATGKVGDRCEVSTYCAACGDCIGTINEAYCRSCCNGNGNGGTCDQCPNTMCGTGFSCARETNNRDSVCIPATGASTCQACTEQKPCAEGLRCFRNRCLPDCNPYQPGACQACFQLSGDEGLCACGEQTAFKGQPCGDHGDGGYDICVFGLACTGSPALCYVPCDNNSQCDTGEICSVVGGQSVCVRSNIPGAKCNSCGDGGTCGAGLTCFNNRCYTPCDLSAPTCNGCVDVTGPNDVCACDDQRNSPGEGCGESGSDVFACSPGSLCIDRTCRLECVQGSDACGPGESCRQVAGTFVCAPTGVVLDGGPVGPDPRPKPDGGQTVNGTDGCGCGAGDRGAGAGLALFAALALLSRAGRRRAPAAVRR